MFLIPLLVSRINFVFFLSYITKVIFVNKEFIMKCILYSSLALERDMSMGIVRIHVAVVVVITSYYPHYL